MNTKQKTKRISHYKVATLWALGSKTAKDLPKHVERYVEEGKEQGLDESEAWAVAWSRYCKYKFPNSPRCKKESPEDYLPNQGKKAAVNPAALPMVDQIKKALASMGASKIKSRSQRNNPVLSYYFGKGDDARDLVLDFLATLQRSFPDMDVKRPRKHRGWYAGKVSKMTPQGEVKFLVTGYPAQGRDPALVSVEVWTPKAPKPAPKAIGKADPLTKRQWSAVLNAMRRGYDNSYSMGVEDAFKPFQRASKKYGLGDYYDGEVFSYLYGKVRSFNGKLSARDVEMLNEMKAFEA